MLLPVRLMTEVNLFVLVLSYLFILLVPVYDGCARDGRAPFLFTDADFNNLPSWPLY